jgi:hypothetical protein
VIRVDVVLAHASRRCMTCAARTHLAGVSGPALIEQAVHSRTPVLLGFFVELGPRTARHHRSRTRTSRCRGQECAHGVSPGFSDCQSRGVAEDGSPAAPIGGTILIPLWPGFGLGDAPRGPGAGGKESHHPGPPPPRLAFDDPFKMPPSAGFSRIAVEMEPCSHHDHPNGRDRRQATVGSWPEKHIATAIVTDAAPDDWLYSARTHAATLSKR